MHGPINVKNPKLYAPTGDQLSLYGKMDTDEKFLTGCLENEQVEGDIDVEVATINTEDEKHVFHAQIVSNGEFRY